MEQDFMKKDLRQAGIDVIVPDKTDREPEAVIFTINHGCGGEMER